MTVSDFNRQRTVFFSKMAQGVPSIGPVQRLLGSPFVSNRGSCLRFHRNLYPDLPRYRYVPFLKRLWRADRILRDADVLVSGSTHSSVLGKLKGKRVMLFHGTFRFLARTQLASLVGFDHILLNGPRMERMFRRLADEFALPSSTVGYVPFSEFPESSEENRERVCAKLGLAPEKPLVLYAPARRDCGSWTQCAEAIARDVPENCGLVMRPHPAQALHAKGDERDLYRRVSRIMADRSGVVDMAVCSFPELLSVADLLIGDATSPNEEFMFYNRPQIITETHPREKWLDAYRHEGMHPDDIDELMSMYDCAFSFVRDGHVDWGEAVTHALNRPAEHAERRLAYMRSAFGEDIRGAAGRAATVLQGLAGTGVETKA